MAFTKQELNMFCGLLLMLSILPLIRATNIDCHEKPFHCVNSTHFMICVDMGRGFSSTIDDFTIPCPKNTECRITNKFECEYPPAPTTSTRPTTVMTASSDAESGKYNDVQTSVSPLNEVHSTVKELKIQEKAVTVSSEQSNTNTSHLGTEKEPVEYINQNSNTQVKALHSMGLKFITAISNNQSNNAITNPTTSVMLVPEPSTAESITTLDKKTATEHFGSHSSYDTTYSQSLTDLITDRNVFFKTNTNSDVSTNSAYDAKSSPGSTEQYPTSTETVIDDISVTFAHHNTATDKVHNGNIFTTTESNTDKSNYGVLATLTTSYVSPSYSTNIDTTQSSTFSNNLNNVVTSEGVTNTDIVSSYMSVTEAPNIEKHTSHYTDATQNIRSTLGEEHVNTKPESVPRYSSLFSTLSSGTSSNEDITSITSRIAGSNNDGSSYLTTNTDSTPSPFLTTPMDKSTNDNIQQYTGSAPQYSTAAASEITSFPNINLLNSIAQNEKVANIITSTPSFEHSTDFLNSNIKTTAEFITRPGEYISETPNYSTMRSENTTSNEGIKYIDISYGVTKPPDIKQLRVGNASEIVSENLQKVQFNLTFYNESLLRKSENLTLVQPVQANQHVIKGLNGEIMKKGNEFLFVPTTEIVYSSNRSGTTAYKISEPENSTKVVTDTTSERNFTVETNNVHPTVISSSNTHYVMNTPNPQSLSVQDSTNVIVEESPTTKVPDRFEITSIKNPEVIEETASSANLPSSKSIIDSTNLQTGYYSNTKLDSTVSFPDMTTKNVVVTEANSKAYDENKGIDYVLRGTRLTTTDTTIFVQTTLTTESTMETKMVTESYEPTSTSYIKSSNLMNNYNLEAKLSTGRKSEIVTTTSTIDADNKMYDEKNTAHYGLHSTTIPKNVTIAVYSKIKQITASPETIEVTERYTTTPMTNINPPNLITNNKVREKLSPENSTEKVATIGALLADTKVNNERVTINYVLRSTVIPTKITTVGDQTITPTTSTPESEQNTKIYKSASATSMNLMTLTPNYDLGTKLSSKRNNVKVVISTSPSTADSKVFENTTTGDVYSSTTLPKIISAPIDSTMVLTTTTPETEIVTENHKPSSKPVMHPFSLWTNLNYNLQEKRTEGNSDTLATVSPDIFSTSKVSAANMTSNYVLRGKTLATKATTVGDSPIKSTKPTYATEGLTENQKPTSYMSISSLNLLGNYDLANRIKIARNPELATTNTDISPSSKKYDESMTTGYITLTTTLATKLTTTLAPTLKSTLTAPETNTVAESYAPNSTTPIYGINLLANDSLGTKLSTITIPKTVTTMGTKTDNKATDINITKNSLLSGTPLDTKNNTVGAIYPINDTIQKQHKVNDSYDLSNKLSITSEQYPQDKSSNYSSVKDHWKIKLPEPLKSLNQGSDKVTTEEHVFEDTALGLNGEKIAYSELVDGHSSKHVNNNITNQLTNKNISISKSYDLKTYTKTKLPKNSIQEQEYEYITTQRTIITTSAITETTHNLERPKFDAVASLKKVNKPTQLYTTNTNIKTNDDSQYEVVMSDTSTNKMGNTEDTNNTDKFNNNTLHITKFPADKDHNKSLHDTVDLLNKLQTENLTLHLHNTLTNTEESAQITINGKQLNSLNNQPNTTDKMKKNDSVAQSNGSSFWTNDGEKPNEDKLSLQTIDNPVNEYIQPTYIQNVQENCSTLHNNQNDVQNTKANFKCLFYYRGRYADAENCRKFYICIGRQSPIIGMCPVNTVFSDIRKQCTRNLSHCVRNYVFRCTSEGRFSDLFVDNIYYICVRNENNKFVRFTLQCEEGYHLDKTFIQCISDAATTSLSTLSDSDNSQKNSDSGSKTNSHESPKITSNNGDFTCEREGKFADPTHCRKYYVCTKNNKLVFKRKLKSCDSDEVFDKHKLKCVDAESNEC